MKTPYDYLDGTSVSMTLSQVYKHGYGAGKASQKLSCKEFLKLPGDWQLADARPSFSLSFVPNSHWWRRLWLLVMLIAKGEVSWEVK